MAGYDLEMVESFLDEELEEALSSLEDATSVIVEQSRVLNLQRAGLNEFQAGNRQAQMQFKRTAGLRQRNRLQGKQNTDLAVEELLQTLLQDATLAQHQLQAGHNAYPNRIAKSLRQDDETLRKLDEISTAAHLIDEFEKHQKDRLDKLCSRLIANHVDEIRCRLDRKYLEAIQSSRNLKAPQSSQAEDLASSIKAELETLYPEISAVALMSIDQTFKAPLAKSIEQSIVQREDEVISVFNEIDATLFHLQEKAAHSITRLLTHDSHLALLNTIINEVETIYLKGSRSSLTASSPAAEQQSSPSKPVLVNRIASVEGEESREHLTHGSHRQLLQILGVPPLGKSNRLEIQNTLNAVISEREKKAKEGVQALNRGIDLSLSTYLNDASCTNSLLVGGLLEDAEFHAVELLNPHLQSRKSRLEMEIDKIGLDMAGLDLDQPHMANQKQEDFVKRWGS